MLHITEDNKIALMRGDTAYLSVPIFNDVTGEETMSSNLSGYVVIQGVSQIDF